jgi:membrane-associated phospholipid phosphatase
MSFPPEGLDALDRDAFLWLNGGLHHLHVKAIDTILEFSNQLGNGIVLVPILAVMLLFGPRGRLGFSQAAGLLAGQAVLWATEGPLKHAFHRPRPQAALADAFARGDAIAAYGERPMQHAFPSGHAATSMAIAFVLASFALALPEPWRRRLALGLLGLGVLLVGLARVYAGAHFPLDVLGGWVLGAGCGTVGVLVGRLIRPRVPRPVPSSGGS